MGDDGNSTDWGDDDEDILFSQIANETEQANLKLLQGDEGKRTEASISPNLATQAFKLRRENLPEKSNSDDGFGTAQGSSLEMNKLLQDMSMQLKAEKQKNQMLVDKLYFAQGTSSNHQRTILALRQTQHENDTKQLKKDMELKKAIEEERKRLKQEITALSTQLRLKESELSKSKMKSAFNRSVGGAQSQAPATAPSRIPALQSQKHRSVPNLLQDPDQSLPVSEPSEKKPSKDRGSQVNADIVVKKQSDSELITGKPAEETVNLTVLPEMVAYREIPVRDQIFTKLSELVDLEFKEISPTIDSIAERAKKEIMARFTRGVEMKTCFPDFTENMFLYGIQSKHRKDMQIRGKEIPKRTPTMKEATATSPGAVNLDKLLVLIKEGFILDSAWRALKEVKTALENFLAVLVGENRFQIYEINNLRNLWKLLSWAKHLWRCIVFEEEFPEVVSTYGQKVYIEELKQWTGIILKVVWRDYYVKDLEIWVRHLSLSILETIVTTGYFETTHKRYEILYSVLKDTLLKDYIRSDARLVRKTLNIINWLLADNKNIVIYLCTNDGNCLASLLGENVVKCFKEQSSYQGTVLFMTYLHLIESLMVDRPPRMLSRVACPELERKFTDERVNDEDLQVGMASQRVMPMDVDDMVMTQYADIDKYKFEEGICDRAKMFNRMKVGRWINPKEWEKPIGIHKEEKCQCRKSLLGNVFIMMHSVVDWWIQEMVKQEQRIEKGWKLEEKQLQVWKQMEDQTKEVQDMIQAFTSKMESLQKHILTVDIADEAGWNEILQSWNPPEDVDPMLTYVGKLHKQTIYDAAVKAGLVVMSFCHYHSENIALAVGSEAFNCWTSLTAELIMFEKKGVMTTAERRLLYEIVQSGGEEDVARGGPSAFSDSGFPDSFKYDFVPTNNREILLTKELQESIRNLPALEDEEPYFLSNDNFHKLIAEIEADVKGKVGKKEGN